MSNVLSGSTRFLVSHMITFLCEFSVKVTHMNLSGFIVLLRCLMFRGFLMGGD